MVITLFIIWAIIIVGLLVFDKSIREIRLHNKRRFFIFTISPIIVIVILFWFIQSVHTLPWIRSSHAVFVLGLWTSVLLIIIKIVYKKNEFYDLIRLVLLLGPILYFTSITHYISFFASIPFAVPFMIGFVYIIVYYGLLLIMNRK